MTLDAARLDRALQEMSGGHIELLLHECRHEVEHGDVHALLLETRRRFEPEQSAADDHGFAARLGGQQHGLHVVEITIREHAGQSGPGHGDDDG